MSIDAELKRDIVRLSKDQERLRLAQEIMETLESMIFYRGGDHSPRMQIIRLLTNMRTACSTELELVDTWRDDDES